MIRFDEKTKTFLLGFGEAGYAMNVQNGTLINRWYGPRLDRFGDLPTVDEIFRRRRIGDIPKPETFAEYGGWSPLGQGTEPAVKVTFDDGTRDLDLRYISHKINGETLTVLLRDEQYAFEVTLSYELFADASTLVRKAALRNGGTHKAVCEIFSSGTVRLPYRDAWRLTSLTGKWAEEYRITRDFLRDGETVLGTRNIMSGPDAVPFFALDEGDADEKRGGVWYGNLLWSGTHRLVFEKGVCGAVSVTAGVNPFDAQIALHPGDCWETPKLALGYTDGGFGEMSRTIHAFTRRHLMSEIEAKRILPVVYNAYGTFFAAVNEEKIMGVIDKAEELGVEALIIDAGWAGEGENYAKGMGEWNENRERFPHGLKAISDELHRRGMKFGLWMEPECAHVDSSLVKEHPDWLFGYPARGADLNGVRYVLNFALDEVCDFFVKKIEALIVSCGVDYFKIDFNRRLYEVGTEHFDDDDKKSVWVRYVENLTRCYQKVKADFPGLLFENCAGGGMRTDLSMMTFSGRINRSDNQDPMDILRLHEGFSTFMLPKLAGGGCHVSDVYTRHFNQRVSPMRYQANAAMMGSFAIGKNLQEITPEETEELKGYVTRFKALRHIVHLGDIYRLVSQLDHDYAVFEYLSADRTEGVVFEYSAAIRFMSYQESVRLDGLDETALYEVWNLIDPVKRDPKKTYTALGALGEAESLGVRSGRSLARVGLPCRLVGDMDSAIVYLKKVQ